MLLLSAAKQVSGLSEKGIALVSLHLFRNHWDQSDAGCDDQAELGGAGSFFGLCLGDSSVGLARTSPELERMALCNRNSAFSLSGSRFLSGPGCVCL